MSKYVPLNEHLYSMAAESVLLTFSQIEEILGAPLPQSARKHAAWWANNPTGHSHCRAWFDAGWRSQKVDLVSETVEFVRVSAGGARLVKSIWGALKNSVTVKDPTALTAPTEESWNAEQGKL